MTIDEISQGREPGPVRGGGLGPRGRRWLGAGAVVVVVMAGALALHREADGRAQADAARAAKAHPTRTAHPGEPVDVGTICPPVTDRRTSLDISFTLVPGAPLVFQDLHPLLPMDGLIFEGYEVRTGGCTTPGTALGEPPFRTSVPVLVTFHFALPPTCPAPYPVGVSAAVQIADQPALTREIVLMPDLGGIAFDTCPTT